MTVVYLDSVFVLNALMDYLLLLATAHLAGIPLRRGRYLISALAGGAYAAAVFLPHLGFLAQTPVKLAAGILLALFAFGGEERLLRLTLLLFLLSCVLAGLVLALAMLAVGSVPMASGIFYTDINVGILLTAATAVYLLLRIVFHASAAHGLQGQILPVRLCICGRTVELTALRDSGNGLRDAVTGKAVLVVAWQTVGALLPWLEDVVDEPEALLRMPQLAPRMIPYRAVGTECGMLLSLRTDWTEINGRRIEGLRIALSPSRLGDGYAALWGGRE